MEKNELTRMHLDELLERVDLLKTTMVEDLTPEIDNIKEDIKNIINKLGD